jgi:hypothetical protein
MQPKSSGSETMTVPTLKLKGIVDARGTTSTAFTASTSMDASDLWIVIEVERGSVNARGTTSTASTASRSKEAMGTEIVRKQWVQKFCTLSKFK